MGEGCSRRVPGSESQGARLPLVPYLQVKHDLTSAADRFTLVVESNPR